MLHVQGDTTRPPRVSLPFSLARSFAPRLPPGPPFSEGDTHCQSSGHLTPGPFGRATVTGQIPGLPRNVPCHAEPFRHEKVTPSRPPLESNGQATTLKGTPSGDSVESEKKGRCDEEIWRDTGWAGSVPTMGGGICLCWRRWSVALAMCATVLRLRSRTRWRH